MEEREFHLCRESWIYVMEQDYQVKEVTLIDALVNADKYRGLAGETETQNIAIIRFLLAVLHTVFRARMKKEKKCLSIRKKRRCVVGEQCGKWDVFQES